MLREATPEEREAWGQINDREVARALRELWDKIPGSYRRTVMQYFRDISELEPAKPQGNGGGEGRGAPKAAGQEPKTEPKK